MDRTEVELSKNLAAPYDDTNTCPGGLSHVFDSSTGGVPAACFLPSLYLAGVDLVPDDQLGPTVSSPFTASRATLALKAGLCFLRPLDISRSFLTATAALSLGAGLSLRYLSRFLGPPQAEVDPIGWTGPGWN